MSRFSAGRYSSVIRACANCADRMMAPDTVNRPDTPPPIAGAEVMLSFKARDLILL